MKKNLLIASILLSGAASAQFTQTNEPAIGAAQPMYELDESASSYSNLTGSGQTWDYSGVAGLDNSPRVLSVVDPTTTPKGAYFTNSTKAIAIEGFITTYMSSSSTERQSQGFVYIDGTDTTVVNINSNTELLMNYPMALSNSLVDTYGGTVISTLAPTTFSCTGNNMAKVDGTGTIILNAATTLTDVTRYMLTDTATATVPFIGNVKIIRTQYEYYTLGSNLELPVFLHSTLSITIGANAPMVQSIVLNQYQPDGFASVDSHTLTGVTVYPNPATETININYYTAEAGNVSIQVLDVTGKIYFSQNANASSGNNTFGIGLDGIESGVYFVQIKNSDKQLIDKFIVTK